MTDSKSQMGVGYRASARMAALAVVLACTFAAAAYLAMPENYRILPAEDFKDSIELSIELSPKVIGDLEIQIPTSWLLVESEVGYENFQYIERYADDVHYGRELLVAALPLEPPRSRIRALSVAFSMLIDEEEQQTVQTEYQDSHRSDNWIVHQIVFSTYRKGERYQHNMAVFSQDARQWWLAKVSGPVSRVKTPKKQILLDFKMLDLMASNAINRQLRPAVTSDFKDAGFVGPFDIQKTIPAHLSAFVYRDRGRYQPILLLTQRGDDITAVQIRACEIPADAAAPFSPAALLDSYFYMVRDRPIKDDERWTESPKQIKLPDGDETIDEFGITLRQDEGVLLDKALVRTLRYISGIRNKHGMLIEIIGNPGKAQVIDSLLVNDVLPLLAYTSNADGQIKMIEASLERGIQLAALVNSKSISGQPRMNRWFDLQLGGQAWGMQVEQMLPPLGTMTQGRTLGLVNFQSTLFRVDRRWSADFDADRFETTTHHIRLGAEEGQHYRVSLVDGQLSMTRKDEVQWEQAAPKSLLWPMSEDSWPVELLEQFAGQEIVFNLAGSSEPPHPHWATIERLEPMEWSTEEGNGNDEEASSGGNFEGVSGGDSGGAWRIRVRPMMAMDTEWLTLDVAGRLTSLDGVSLAQRHTGSVPMRMERIDEQQAADRYPELHAIAKDWINEYKSK